MRDIGKQIGDEFSKGFFLSHFHFTGQKLRLKLTSLPGNEWLVQLQREISGLRNVLDIKAAGDGFDVELAGGGNAADLVAATIVQPLNANSARRASPSGRRAATASASRSNPAAKGPATLARLDTLPPAALYEAPAERRKAVVKNPETLKKFSI